VARGSAPRDRAAARLRHDLPDGAALQHRHLAGHVEEGLESPIAGWTTKRRWLDYAFEQFLAHDYEIAGSDIVATKTKDLPLYLPRCALARRRHDRLGVSSFSHFGGVNFQNAHNFEEYVRILNEDRLPLLRAVSLTPKQRLIREMVLQLKTGARHRLFQ
jgi:oxygen-independent coproporphyrinogen-3 oxidase